MKIKNWCLVSVFFLVFSFSSVTWSHAGGAVAARQGQQKKMMQQKAQAQQQRTLMQQRLDADAAAKQRAGQENMQRQQKTILDKQRQEDAVIERSRQEESAREERAQAEVKDEVDAGQLLASFEVSSEAWPLIIDEEAKDMVVSAYIDQYRTQGTVINKSSTYYTSLINAVSQQSPDMLNQPLRQVLKILAIVEYDFNNGQDKDALALKVLGSQQAVMQNKKRLGL
jgi:hypothetical protein